LIARKARPVAIQLHTIFIMSGCNRTGKRSFAASLVQVPVHCIVMDMSNMAEVREIESQLPETVKEVDILVNNAGLALGVSPAQELDLDVRFSTASLCH
jgi:NADP-dependent 3-hydroxy acid dehydrogenase YdfG